jgi:hypothetical protein
MEVMSMHVHVLCTCVEYLRIFLYVTYIQYHIDIKKNYGSTKVLRSVQTTCPHNVPSY